MRKINKTKNTKNRYRRKSKSMRRTRKGGSAQSNYYNDDLNNDDPNSNFPVKNNANQRYQILTLKKLLLYIEDKQLVKPTDELQTLNDRLSIAIQNLEQLQKLDKSEKIVCQYNYKFKRWVPKKLASSKSEIISVDEFQNITKYYEQNKKKY